MKLCYPARVIRIAIAGIGLVLLAGAGGGVADAKPKPKQTCEEKYTACVKRCFQRYPGNNTQLQACAQRTCKKQNENCLKNEKPSKFEGTRPGEKPGLVQTPPVLEKPGSVTAPPSGGILQTPEFTPRPPKPSGTGTAAPN